MPEGRPRGVRSGQSHGENHSSGGSGLYRVPFERTDGLDCRPFNTAMLVSVCIIKSRLGNPVLDDVPTSICVIHSQRIRKVNCHVRRPPCVALDALSYCPFGNSARPSDYLLKYHGTVMGQSGLVRQLRRFHVAARHISNWKFIAGIIMWHRS
jgi:hypothetical protein